MKAEKKAKDYDWNIKTQAGQRLLTQETLDAVHEPYSLEEKRVPLILRPVYAHFFIGNWDWYLMEVTDLENGIFWGFVNDRTDPFRSEFGSEAFLELARLTVEVPIHNPAGAVIARVPCCVERDIYWKVCPFGEIDEIPQRFKK